MAAHWYSPFWDPETSKKRSRVQTQCSVGETPVGPLC